MINYYYYKVESLFFLSFSYVLLEYIHKIKEVTTTLISVMTFQLEFIGKKLAQRDANENSIES
jgi:hypothetical protein